MAQLDASVMRLTLWDWHAPCNQSGYWAIPEGIIDPPITPITGLNSYEVNTTVQVVQDWTVVDFRFSSVKSPFLCRFLCCFDFESTRRFDFCLCEPRVCFDFLACKFNGSNCECFVLSWSENQRKLRLRILSRCCYGGRELCGDLGFCGWWVDSRLLAYFLRYTMSGMIRALLDMNLNSRVGLFVL